MRIFYDLKLKVFYNLKWDTLNFGNTIEIDNTNTEEAVLFIKMIEVIQTEIESEGLINKFFMEKFIKGNKVKETKEKVKETKEKVKNFIEECLNTVYEEFSNDILTENFVYEPCDIYYKIKDIIEFYINSHNNNIDENHIKSYLIKAKLIKIKNDSIIIPECVLELDLTYYLNKNNWENSDTLKFYNDDKNKILSRYFKIIEDTDNMMSFLYVPSEYINIEEIIGKQLIIDENEKN